MNTNLGTLETKEGKAKILEFEAGSQVCKMTFKNVLTALNGKQAEEKEGKGALNATISAKLFGFLNSQKIQTHFIKQLTTDTLQVSKLNMIPLEVIIRNYASGSICKRLGIKQGTKLKKTIVQFHLKDDALNDPLLTEDELFEMDLISKSDLRKIRNNALMIDWLLRDLFQQAGICLVDLKLEFGFDQNRQLVLGDELSPDNMRLWENYKGENFSVKNNDIKKLDKDRFREGLGDVLENYQVVLDKLSTVLEQPTTTEKTPINVDLYIHPQQGLLDPTGRTLTSAVNQLGFLEVDSIRSGKLIELQLNDLRVDLIDELCERILVSPASESYEYELSE
ncbi:MAG: phosphoribosylaminoimidazolesuccinocarboxamide synthase [Candidatus Caenarcaniphilales bacterium]|nr:phosphoribosylaminoimidazolesuccinocarboxamide synthase [Candidatus Caenarcaniphilales bacterium]